MGTSRGDSFSSPVGPGVGRTRRCRRGLVLALHVLNQVDDSGGISELVVVPRNEFDELIVEGNAGLGVENRGVTASDEIRGNHLVFGVPQNAFHGSVSGFLDFGFDGVVGSGLGQSETDETGVEKLCEGRWRGRLLRNKPDGEVDDGNVVDRHPERHSREFSVQGRNDFTHGFGGSGRGGYDVLSGPATVSPKLPGRAVDGFLSGRYGVHGRHETLDDAEIVVYDFGKRGKAVSRAGGVRNYFVLRIVRI